MGLILLVHLPPAQLRDDAMDLWGFRKWRQKLGYTQSVAGEKLGLSRGAIQYWESEARPVPLAVELACQELLRLWTQRPELGPVTLIYACDAVSLETSASAGSMLVRSERHPDSASAMTSAARLAETAPSLLRSSWMAMAALSGLDQNCCVDARKNTAIGEKTSAAKAPSSR